MKVLDASVVLDLLLRVADVEPIEERVFGEGHLLSAPHLLDLEVAQVLRRYTLSDVHSPERGAQALRDLADLPLSRYPHTLFLPRIWELRPNLTAYDAVYVALAEALDATLLTRDRGIGAAPGVRARVEVI